MRALASLKDDLARAGLVPDKALGQHFLFDPNLLDALVASMEVEPGQLVFEIGGGLGQLSERLARVADRVVIVEFDSGLARFLEEKFREDSHVEVVHTDVRHFDFDGLFASWDGPMVAYGNLPYNLSSEVISLLVDQGSRWRRIYVMIQREVGLRLAAKPGTKEYGRLTVSASHVCDIRVARTMPPNVYFPRPKVHSILLEMTPKPDVDMALLPWMRAAAALAFGQRRKTLRNAFQGVAGGKQVTQETALAICEAAGIDSARRGETLALEEFTCLAEHLRDL